MTPEQDQVELLASKESRLDAMRALLGAVNTRDLRDTVVSDEVLAALTAGLAHADPRIRFWSVQLLDHCPDARAIEPIVPLLDDPVPRVRRNAVHALGCAACKPAWSGELDATVLAKIEAMASGDANAGRHTHRAPSRGACSSGHREAGHAAERQLGPARGCGQGLRNPAAGVFNGSPR